MQSNTRFIAVIVPLVAIAGLVLTWQHHTTEELRGKIARQRTQSRELAKLNAANQRLVTAQPSAEELQKLLADRKAIARLRADLETMRRRAAAAPNTADGPPAKAAPSLTGNLVAYQLWKDVGQATPDATFETVLWAAAGGELGNVADLLAFDANTRSRAAAIFAELPESIRNELGTPERLIALLVADDVPLGRASVVAQIPTPTDTKVIAQILDTDGTQKLAQFSLRADGNSWRLVVPEKVVQRYAARFQSP
jgi:hypothetical protein